MSNYYQSEGSSRNDRRYDRGRESIDWRNSSGRGQPSRYSNEQDQPGTSRMDSFGYNNSRGSFGGYRPRDEMERGFYRENDRHSNRDDYRRRDNRGKKDKYKDYLPSFPSVKKLNPQDEHKRKAAQKQRDAIEAVKRQIELLKDNSATLTVRDRDEDDDDDDDMAAHGFSLATPEPASKRRRSRSPARSPRRRSPTPPRTRAATPQEEERPEILDRIRDLPEGRDCLERFSTNTRNMDLYVKKRFIYGKWEEIKSIFNKIEYGRGDPVILVPQLFIRDYHPQHSLFLEEIIASKEVPELLKDKIIVRPEINLNTEEIESRVNFPRITEVKIDQKNVENNFRTILMETDGLNIPISSDPDNYEEPWQKREREEREKADADLMLKIKAKFDNENMHFDEGIVQAELRIIKNPKDFNGYLEFCKAIDDYYQPRKLTMSKPLEKLDHCLSQGIAMCPAATALYIELGQLRAQQSKEDGREFFERNIERLPFDQELMTAYLDTVQFKKNVYCSQLMERAFWFVRHHLQKILNSGKSLDPQVIQELELFSINVWIRHLLWLIESGYEQRAIASIQASFESSYFHSRQGMPPYPALYDSGAPRLGDKSYSREHRSYDIVENIGIEELEIKEEMEQERVATKFLESRENLGKEALSLHFQRLSDEIISRPIRCSQQSWIGVPRELEQHLKKRKWVPYEKLILQRLRFKKPEEDGGPLYILKHFGFSIENESYSYSHLAKKYGLSSIRDALPLQAQMTLLRIFSQVLTLPLHSQYTADLPANIVAYCSKAYPKEEVTRKSMELLDELVAVPSRHRAPEINEAFIYLVLKELLRLNIVAKEILTRKLMQVCQAATRNMGSELWGRIAFSYMVTLAGVMSCEEFESHLPKWLSLFYNIQITEKSDCLQILAEAGFLPVPWISDQTDPLRLISSLPSTTSLSLTLCTFLLNTDEDRFRLAAIQQLVHRHMEAFPDEKAGVQELHYAMIKYLETTVEKCRNRNGEKKFFHDELLAHVSVFPNHQEGIQLFLKHFKSATPLIMFNLPGKSLYPIRRNTDKNSSEFEIFTRLALFDRTIDCQEKEVQESVDHFLCQQLMKVAEKINDPNIWRLALKKANGSYKHRVYELARNKCVWSKGLYLDYMEAKQNSPILGSENIMQTMTRYHIPNIMALNI